MINSILLSLITITLGFAQQRVLNTNAHAHNDYEHNRPLWDALANQFGSVEADVYLSEGNLLVSHNKPALSSKTLSTLYLKPLDSLLQRYGRMNSDSAQRFYLMIDFKTEAEPTYRALMNELKNFPQLLCFRDCPVVIYISGNRPLNQILESEYAGVALDGRPADLDKNIDVTKMPVISDHYRNWSSWNGETRPGRKELERIKTLAKRVHKEGKRLRLWAIPDHPMAWQYLAKAGVDIINTDKLEAYNKFLQQRK